MRFVAAMLLVSLVGTGWALVSARGDNAALLEQRDELLEQIAEEPTPAGPGPDLAATSDEDRAAMLMVAIQHAEDLEQLSKVKKDAEQLRRRVERAESATARERKAKSESCRKRDELLKERRQLLGRIDQLERACSQLLNKVDTLQAAARRRQTSRF